MRMKKTPEQSSEEALIILKDMWQAIPELNKEELDICREEVLGMRKITRKLQGDSALTQFLSDCLDKIDYFKKRSKYYFS